MKYTKTEIIELLLHTGLIAPVSKGYLINSKLQEMASTKHISSFCKNLPKRYMGITDEAVYDNILSDCAVPSMYKKDIKYYLRTKSIEAIQTLKMILRNPDIDYTRFVTTTRYFYGSDMAVPSFSNYLVKGKWELVYKDTDNDKEEKYSRKGTV